MKGFDRRKQVRSWPCKIQENRYFGRIEESILLVLLRHLIESSSSFMSNPVLCPLEKPNASYLTAIAYVRICSAEDSLRL